MGVRMSGTPMCANTAPSVKRTMLCTTLCGLTTTVMRSYGTQLSFDVPDLETFRCLGLAVEAGKKAAIVECGGEAGAGRGGDGAAGPEGTAAACPVRTVAAPIVLNAANEVAVEAFLGGRLPFLGVAEIVEKCLTWLGDEPVERVEDVYACDDEARRFAREATGRTA